MQKRNLVIEKGKTFMLTVRWEQEPFVYKAISDINQGAPARLTVTGHGLVDNWRASVISAGGMRQINAKHTPPGASDFHKITVVDVNTVELNDVDSSDFSSYTSGGYLKYYRPVDLAGYTARMQVRTTARASGDPLLELTTENGRIDIDNTTKAIRLVITATDTAAVSFVTGVYDLELVSGAGVVTGLLTGNVTVVEEVTR